jgi:hypothetical protein
VAVIRRRDAVVAPREGGTVAVYRAGSAVAVIQWRRRRHDVVAVIQHQGRGASRR